MNRQEQDIPKWLQKIEGVDPIMYGQAKRFFLKQKDLLKEAEFLLFIHGPSSCPEWIEGVGDCKKMECKFCRASRFLDATEEQLNVFDKV